MRTGEIVCEFWPNVLASGWSHLATNCDGGQDEQNEVRGHCSLECPLAKDNDGTLRLMAALGRPTQRQSALEQQVVAGQSQRRNKESVVREVIVSFDRN